MAAAATDFFPRSFAGGPRCLKERARAVFTATKGALTLEPVLFVFCFYRPGDSVETLVNIDRLYNS